MVFGAGLYLMYNTVGPEHLLAWPLIMFLTLEIFEKPYLSMISDKVKAAAWVCHVARMGVNLYTAGRTALHAVPAGDPNVSSQS